MMMTILFSVCLFTVCSKTINLGLCRKKERFLEGSWKGKNVLNRFYLELAESSEKRPWWMKAFDNDYSEKNQLRIS